MGSESEDRLTTLSPEVRSLATTILAENREELAKADQKSTALLSVVMVVVGVLLAGMIAGDWAPSKLHGWAEPVWWIGAALAFAAIVLLVLAVVPRGHRRRSGSPRACYFGDLRSCSSEAELAAALASECSAESDRALDQILVTAHIVGRKYTLILWGLAVLGLATALTIIAVLSG